MCVCAFVEQNQREGPTFGLFGMYKIGLQITWQIFTLLLQPDKDKVTFPSALVGTNGGYSNIPINRSGYLSFYPIFLEKKALMPYR